METTPLRSFATWARTALIREVTARLAAVLAPGSTERVEQAKAVAALEHAINAAGGGDQGRAAIAARVAYTWFNRIVALRFMDANGYTGIGVVSPQTGLEVGQPEILAEAKRGAFNDEVVTRATQDIVAGLLNGTRPSNDPQGEAYSALLTDYCRHWNEALPFMFEREGDYTELLIPAGLLADGSVLSRAVQALSSTVCSDVEVLGWLYQFYIADVHDEVFAAFKKKQKAGPADIPAATQLFTPNWIVRYLVENSLGQLWMLNRPNSALVSNMDLYLAPSEVPATFPRLASPEDIRLIDPACGSGHLLVYAFDLLYLIYEEEGYAPSEIPKLILTKNIFGTEIDPRAASIAAFALAMKARARHRRLFSSPVEPNVVVLAPASFGGADLETLVEADPGVDRIKAAAFWNQFEHADTFGALIAPSATDVRNYSRQLPSPDEEHDLFTQGLFERAQRVVTQARVLANDYHVVVANPPYMGGGNMDARLAEMVGEAYPRAKQDLYACFVERSRSLLAQGGLLAIITGDSWMSLKTFKGFREHLLNVVQLHSFLHLDDVSKHADVVGANTALIGSAGERSTAPCTFVHLEPLRDADKQARLRAAVQDPGQPWVYCRTPTDFSQIPGTPIAYGLTDEDLRAFATGCHLGDVISFREGINTGDNDRFLRRWWEIDISRASLRKPAPEPNEKWVPMKKGGPFRRWAGNQEYVVNWANNGQEIRNFRDASGRLRSVPRNTDYFLKPSVSWGRISSGDFSMRYYEAGYGFDSTGPCGFASEHTLKFVLGYLNSNLAKRFLGAMSSTLDFRLGNMSNLPAPSKPDEVDTSHIDELVSLAQQDWDLSETAWDFTGDPLIATGQSRIEDAWLEFQKSCNERTERLQELEELNNERMAAAFGLTHVDHEVARKRVALNGNPDFQFSHLKDEGEREAAWKTDVVKNLVSYAVGVMFGRYSLDAPGLVLATQEATMEDYSLEVPAPSFRPDSDNVVPVIDGDWFEDDVVSRFRAFLRQAFGEAHFEENLRFVTDALGVRDVRDYFVRSFNKDHVQRYKKRPIYWLFSSPQGSFNALIYIHRYTPSTVSTVLNEYLREFQAKLKANLAHSERSGQAKEADRLRKVLLELDAYEHDVLYPLASKNVAIDLDDGVRVNYPLLGAALRDVGLEGAE